MQSARRWVLAASVVILVPGAVPEAPADDPEVAEGLSRLERAVELAPDDLQLGNAYRMAVIRSDETERAIEFLSGLLEQNQQSNPLRINLALAYVDRLSRPGTSRTAQGRLARRSLDQLDAVLERDPTNWLALFSRGMNHLHSPRARTSAARAIRDFESCLALQAGGAIEPNDQFFLPHVRLGDAYATADDPEAARRVWRQGLLEFPRNESLAQRLSLDDESLAEFVEGQRRLDGRIPTDLSYLIE